MMKQSLSSELVSSHSTSIRCHSSNCSHVLAVLVSYYSPQMNRVVVEHFAALDLVTLHSESMYTKLVSLFEENGLPWDHLVSILMDSCAV